MTSSWSVLASGIGMTEGPLWTAGGRLLVTSISRGGIYDVALDGSGAHPVLWTGGSPSGLVEMQTDIWIAQGGHKTRNPELTHLVAPPSIQRWSDGHLAAAVTAGLSAPNDLALGPDGRIWFTDPVGYPFDGLVPTGCLWAWSPHSGELELIDDSLQFPNGLAFSADGDLVVGETAARRLVVFRRTGLGWAGPAPFTRMPGGYPDGMAFDSTGRLYVAGTRGNAVFVYDVSGAERERLSLEGDFPTNCAFAGPNLSTLVVTVANGGRVLALEREVPGLPLHGGSISAYSTRAGGME